MSYDATTGLPDQLWFNCNPSGELELRFICPRCGRKNYHIIDIDDLLYSFEVVCYDPACKAPGEKFGYQLTFVAGWSQLVLNG